MQRASAARLHYGLRALQVLRLPLLTQRWAECCSRVLLLQCRAVGSAVGDGLQQPEVGVTVRLLTGMHVRTRDTARLLQVP